MCWPSSVHMMQVRRTSTQVITAQDDGLIFPQQTTLFLHPLLGRATSVQHRYTFRVLSRGTATRRHLGTSSGVPLFTGRERAPRIVLHVLISSGSHVAALG